jgi:hypothetical protein
VIGCIGKVYRVYSLAIKHSPTNPNYRIFLRRLVKPKTIEEFPEIVAEQEALRRRILVPLSVPQTSPFGSSARGTQHLGFDPFAGIQPPKPVTTFPNGVPRK